MKTIIYEVTYRENGYLVTTLCSGEWALKLRDSGIHLISVKARLMPQ